jgi:succinate dehydrogenase / fumarate reductase cytochrome b subunit
MAEAKTERPLSPHLQIYRPMLTMMMSIVHRITGVGLALGMLFLVWWLSAASETDSYFAFVQGLYGSIVGRILLLGFSWALIHHALGGLRHLLWDTGRGFDLKLIEWLARGNLAGSIILTVALWLLAYWVRP